MLAKLLSEAIDKIMESSYNDENTVRGIAKAAAAGVIDGLGNAAIILGTAVMITALANKVKGNNVSEKE